MKKLLIIIMALFMLTSCGTYRQSVLVDDKAYLLLIGDPMNNVVTIDNNKPIDLAQETTSYDLNGKTATKIEVSIGSHTVKITKGGVLTVNRKFYVSTGTSFEVQL
ncbi:MAG: hypothetical protein GQ572_03360 [Gammaproteobacteria bacterium]|jgi:uncharacterized protein YxeA|nr:hypothetical protein [Gammaproteobacteria bacterium]